MTNKSPNTAPCGGHHRDRCHAYAEATELADQVRAGRSARWFGGSAPFRRLSWNKFNPEMSYLIEGDSADRTTGRYPKGVV